MHSLSRQVRFAINPFADSQVEGFNSYCAKPCGEGLDLFFALRVEITSQVNHQTGFVVNITDIDKAVRKFAVGLFAETINRSFSVGKSIDFLEMIKLLSDTAIVLGEYFGKEKITDICLDLNPARMLGLRLIKGNIKMIYYGEKFDFAAMHKLWNEKFSDEENFRVFGKCANPTGHGHNYTTEVVVKLPLDNQTFKIADYQKTVKENFLDIVDHKNLNGDVEYFKDNNPTVENIAKLAWLKLNDKFENSKLHKITIWETDKTFCSYCGDEGE